MRRVAVAILAMALASPVLAQTPANLRAQTDADLKALMAKYVVAFNKGDAAALARDFYRLPDAPEADVAAKFAKQIADLRREEFGKMEIFSASTCVDGTDSAKVQIDFAYNYTYGGLMPPGEQATAFDLMKTADGWRIVRSTDLQSGQKMVCAF